MRTKEELSAPGLQSRNGEWLLEPPGTAPEAGGELGGQRLQVLQTAAQPDAQLGHLRGRKLPDAFRNDFDGAQAAIQAERGEDKREFGPAAQTKRRGSDKVATESSPRREPWVWWEKGKPQRGGTIMRARGFLSPLCGSLAACVCPTAHAVGYWLTQLRC